MSLSPMMILGILLAISVAGNGILAKLYVGAEKEVAKVTQAFDSFKAEEKSLGEIAQKKADQQKADDAKRKKDADNENAATVARLNSTIGKLRADADGARPNLVPSAPPGSKCPDGQACFDNAALESTLRIRRDRIRGLADESAAIEADLNTAKRWAQGGVN